jgi:hypothetical protein
MYVASRGLGSVTNDAIFRNAQPVIFNAKQHFMNDFAQVILRAKKSCEPLIISQWLEAFV